MSAVTIANSSRADAAAIAQTLGTQHTITVTTSAAGLAGTIERCDLLILDTNLTDAGGMDVLMEVASVKHLPILMVVPANDPQCALEAVRSGAYNYLVKVADYLKLVPHAVNDALARFYESDALQRTITGLKARIAELEARLLAPPPPAAAVTAQATPARPPKTSAMAEILTLMRQGEINLPVYPKTVLELKHQVEAQAPLKAIVRLLEQDVAIASKLVSVSNTAYYRGTKDSHTLAEAIGRLGLQQTCNIVELLSNRALYAIHMPSLQAFLPALWTHAVACAHAAHLTARHLDFPAADEAFTMGLLHDIGKLLLLQIIGELQLRGSLASLDPPAAMALAHEHHCRFGAEILKRWKLPASIATVALWHENIMEAEEITNDLLVVSFADMLADSLGYGHTKAATTDIAAAEPAQLLKLTPAAIDAITQDLRKLMTGCDFSV